MKILIACEESQTVTKAFRKLGHEAYSCDIQECSGGHPEWHILGDAITEAYSGKYDMMIAHPPCTYLSVSGLHWNKRVPGRSQKTAAALDFVSNLLNAPIHYIALENPISIISTAIRKPNQIIQPYQFGHPESKATCLWLKNLPPLIPTLSAEWKMYRCKCGNVFEAELGKYGCCDYPAKPLWDNQTKSGQNKLPPSKDRAKIRSKTYQGIADAIASQWGILPPPA
jgi:hypothetical protein